MSLFPDGVVYEQYRITAVVAGQESPPSAVVSAPRNSVWTADGAIALSWDAVADADSYRVYKFYNGIFGWLTSTTGTSFSDRNIQPDVGRAPPEAIDPFTDGNNPTTAALYEQRLALAASDDNPQTVYMSRTGFYENFDNSIPPRDDDGVEFTIAAQQVNKIQHMVALRHLVLLTANSIWRATGSGEYEPITPGSIRVQVQSYSGADEVAPAIINDTLIYVTSKGNGVRDLYYELAEEGYTGSDLAILSKHLFEGRTIVSTGYAEAPHSVLWMVRDDGVLLGLTYLREQDVWAWHRHDTDGEFKQVCTVREDDRDAVYLVVDRDGSLFIERLECRNECLEDIEDAWFLDSALRYDGEETSTITGLWHLEGREVSVYADGSMRESAIVSGGRVTLAEPASKILIGLPYVSELETLDLTTSGEGAALQTRRKKLSRLFVRLLKTRGLKAGQNSESPLVELRERFQENYGAPITPMEGLHEINAYASWGRRGGCYFKQEHPLPATILGVTPEFEAGN